MRASGMEADDWVTNPALDGTFQSLPVRSLWSMAAGRPPTSIAAQWAQPKLGLLEIFSGPF
jgi:hypothetical protein